jgi:hypothetical protein
MISEDEFKCLTDSLESIGQYDPSVREMLICIEDSNDRLVEFDIHYWGNLEHFSVKVLGFTECGRFGKAILEFASNPNRFFSLLSEMGLTNRILIHKTFEYFP